VIVTFFASNIKEKKEGNGSKLVVVTFFFLSLLLIRFKQKQKKKTTPIFVIFLRGALIKGHGVGISKCYCS
jgi:hypothetical protein